MNEKEQILEQLAEMLNKPNGKQAARFILNSFGAIPFVGGVISASGSLWGEKEQQEFNQKFLEWATETNANLEKTLIALKSQLTEPTRANFSLLLGEALGLELPFIIQENTSIEVNTILNTETLAEFKRFEETGWLTIIPTGNITNMGSGNSFGNTVEDKKRPWGMGNGFVLRIDSSIYNEE